MEGSANSRVSDGGIVLSKQSVRIENPFTFKALTVFTGFGFGCGVGIGFGTALDLNAITFLRPILVASRGATDAFSSAATPVNRFLRKFRLEGRTPEAGIGCGVGFGHGYGIGFAVKPGVVHQVQSYAVQAMSKMITKFGIAPDLSTSQGTLPESSQSGMTMLNDLTIQNPIGSIMQLAKGVPINTSQVFSQEVTSQTVPSYEAFASKGSPLSTSYSSRTEKVIDNFLQSPFMNGDDRGSNKFSHENAERLRSENNMLHLVLKHQQVIEELIEENKKLREILVEDLKIPPSRLGDSYSGRNTSPCADCSERRRKKKR